MAKKKAKPKAEKKRSYAEATGGVKTPSVFAKTTCNLKTPPTYPNRRIPATKEKNSFFVDLRSTDATDLEVAEALEAQCRGISGVIYRDDLRVVEVVFFTVEQRDGNVKEIAIEGKKPVFPILPRELMPTVLYVRMANLPFGSEAEIKTAIEGYWSDFGKVLDVAAHKVHGKWLTRRWDMLLEMPKGEKLDAPVAFQLLAR